MSKDAENRIVAKGEWGKVEYAVRSDGSMPAQKDLGKLKKENLKAFVRLDVLFKHFAQTGKLKPQQFRSLQGKRARENKLSEFKRDVYRVACFVIRNRCFLTHLFGKKNSSRYVNNQIDKAANIREEHLEKERRKKR